MILVSRGAAITKEGERARRCREAGGTRRGREGGREEVRGVGSKHGGRRGE